MKNILVLCTGNSCRSQLAQGYLQYFAGDKAKIYSAGIETHGVNPKAIEVCDNANEACPFFPGNVKRFHQNFPDPAKAKGSPEEVLDEFRKVRDLIKVYAENFVKQNINP